MIILTVDYELSSSLEFNNLTSFCRNIIQSLHKKKLAKCESNSRTMGSVPCF